MADRPNSRVMPGAASPCASKHRRSARFQSIGLHNWKPRKTLHYVRHSRSFFASNHMVWQNSLQDSNRPMAPAKHNRRDSTARLSIASNPQNQPTQPPPKQAVLFNRLASHTWTVPPQPESLRPQAKQFHLTHTHTRSTNMS